MMETVPSPSQRCVRRSRCVALTPSGHAHVSLHYVAHACSQFDANLKDKTRKMLEERFEAGFVFDADEWAKGAKGEAAVEPTAEEPVAAAEPVAAVEEGTKTDMGMRYNTLRASPADATFKLAVVQFKVDLIDV